MKISILTIFLVITVVCPYIGFAETADVGADNLQYGLHRSELIRNFALTGTLRLTWLLLPLDWKSQRLFSDDLNGLDESIRDAETVAYRMK